MLATLVDKPFSDPGWLFEPKLDGFRILAFIQKGEVTLRTRNGNDYTGQPSRTTSLLPPGALCPASWRSSHLYYPPSLAIMRWTTTAMLDRYTSWMENESEEALEAFRGLRP